MSLEPMERQPYGGLTPGEVDAIAERAAEKALNHVYANVGRGVLRKITWLLGVVIVSAAMWLASTGALRP